MGEVMHDTCQNVLFVVTNYICIDLSLKRDLKNVHRGFIHSWTTIRIMFCMKVMWILCTRDLPIDILWYKIYNRMKCFKDVVWYKWKAMGTNSCNSEMH